jgi:hypothetical protein
MQSDSIEEALADVVPTLETLIETCGKRIDPENAAATVATAELLASTVSAKIGEAKSRLKK